MGLRIEDLKYLTFVDVLKIFYSFSFCLESSQEDTKEDTKTENSTRKATQADIDKFFM